MSEVNPNYNPQADFKNFGEEMAYIVETTPKEVLKEEWDKVLAEYGTDTHDKILSMTDEFVQSNRSEGQTYAHYHYDMMADFALHILETFNTKEKMTPKEKAQDLWLRYYELIDDDYSNEAAKKMAKEYAQIAVDEIMKSLDDVLHPNPFGQYWNKVKQEIENL